MQGHTIWFTIYAMKQQWYFYQQYEVKSIHCSQFLCSQQTVRAIFLKYKILILINIEKKITKENQQAKKRRETEADIFNNKTDDPSPNEPRHKGEEKKSYKIKT